MTYTHTHTHTPRVSISQGTATPQAQVRVRADTHALVSTGPWIASRPTMSLHTRTQRQGRFARAHGRPRHSHTRQQHSQQYIYTGAAVPARWRAPARAQSDGRARSPYLRVGVDIHEHARDWPGSPHSACARRNKRVSQAAQAPDDGRDKQAQCDAAASDSEPGVLLQQTGFWRGITGRRWRTGGRAATGRLGGRSSRVGGICRAADAPPEALQSGQRTCRLVRPRAPAPCPICILLWRQSVLDRRTRK